MKIEEVRERIGDVPHMTLLQADKLTKHIADQRIENILELGCFHGVSTCYMAGALAEQRRGSIVTIDLEGARRLSPNVETLLEKIGERSRVQVYYEPTSYTWRLMRLLEEDPTPRFDLCYIDGVHSWFVDALAFFLADRLLRPGGWVVLDDLDWTYGSSPALRESDKVRRMPADEQATPQVRKIYELLVKTHPNYHNFRIEEGWAFAQKRAAAPDSAAAAPREFITEQVVRIERVHVGLGGFLMRAAKKLRGKKNRPPGGYQSEK